MNAATATPDTHPCDGSTREAAEIRLGNVPLGHPAVLTGRCRSCGQRFGLGPGLAVPAHERPAPGVHHVG